MAIRNTFLSLLVVILLPQCTPATKTGNVSKKNIIALEKKFNDRAPADDMDNIAIFTPATATTFEMWKTLSEELSEEFNIRTMVTTPATNAGDIGEYMRKVKPVAVVLVDNSTVKNYKKYQSYHTTDHTPVFIFMASFVKEIIGMISNANGIAYEVPGVLSMVRARNILKTQVVKVGAVNRKAFDDYVKTEASMMKVEKFTMVSAEISDAPDQFELEAALDDLLNKEKVDVLWILNDNALLKPALIADVWLPTLHNAPMPTIVNVPVLLNPEVEFGTLAVIPDSAALGVQAANMIFNAYDMDWKIEDNYVELPLSVLTYIDKNNAETNFGLRRNAANFIDKQQ